MTEQIIEHIVNFLNSLPLWFRTVVVLLAAPLGYILYALVFKDSFRNDMMKAIKLSKKRLTTDDIINHPIFSPTIQYKILLNRIDCKEVKKKYIVAFMKTKIDIHYTTIRAFVLSICKEETDLQVEIKKYIDNIQLQSNSIIMTEFATYTKNSEQAFKIINDTYSDINSSNVAFLESVLRSFSTSHLTYNEKVYLFLTMLETYININILDVPQVINKVNGQLEKVVQ